MLLQLIGMPHISSDIVLLFSNAVCVKICKVTHNSSLSAYAHMFGGVVVLYVLPLIYAHIVITRNMQGGLKNSVRIVFSVNHIYIYI
jgi:hypothetical protein